MKAAPAICCFSILVGFCGCIPHKAVVPQAIIPGQTLHIQHQLNKNHPANSSVKPISRPLADIVGDNWGNDFEAPAGVGFKWLSVPDDPAYWEPSDPASPNF